MLFSLSLENVDQVFAGQITWTEKKVGKAAIKADKAAMGQKWLQAIKYGEQMLSGTEALYGQHNINYISRLKTLNRYYDKAGRLGEISDRVKKAYILSKKHFKPDHDTAVLSRLLYYKYLISQKNYHRSAQIVLENISGLSNSKKDDYKKLHYLTQLHGLYGLTDQLEAQEKILIKLLALNKRLVGIDKEDNLEIIMNLAKNYCLQKKNAKFDQLMQTYDLNFEC